MSEHPFVTQGREYFRRASDAAKSDPENAVGLFQTSIHFLTAGLRETPPGPERDEVQALLTLAESDKAALEAV